MSENRSVAGEEMGEGLEVEIIKGFEESFWRDLCRNGWFLQVHFIVSSTVLFLPLNLGSLRQLETSLVAQTVKRLPTLLETLVRSLGREDPLEKEMETRSSTLAWKIPWMEERGRLQSMGSERVGHN